MYGLADAIQDLERQLQRETARREKAEEEVKRLRGYLYHILTLVRKGLD
jgi:hypothetical protein